MYSKEDRERILADFAASGLSGNAFCRLPGSPSRPALGRWLAQAARGELDVPERSVRGRCEHAKHARYPEETKREAVSLARGGMSPAAVARRLGVASGDVVSSWVRRAAGGARMAPKGAVGMNAAEAAARIAELEAELAEERMRTAALRELMRDPKAGDPASLSNSRKAELGERLRRDYGYRLRDVLTLLRISKSSYEYARRANGRAEARAAEVSARVRHAFEASRRRYGYRRVRASVASGADGLEPMAVSEREVRRAMREGAMRPVRTRRRARWTSYRGEPDERPANLPLRGDGSHDFSAGEPDRLVVTDVTEFAVAGGAKVYLSPVIDCFDGMPVSWSVSRRPDSALVDSSLLAYAARLPEGHPPVTAHSDGGATYRSRSWKGICERSGIVRSMSRRGRCPDNARMEGFFGTLKEELYNGRDWSRTSPEEFAGELDAYMEWYRDGRLKLFVEGGAKVYDTIAGRRRRLGHAA
ncbi:MAG TPA: IS3 family transposase [Candidatus Coprousia avicola]|nr:IS3 family transposase [Candidatus Coprousia avicola]